MSTRRDLAAGLLALPAIGNAAKKTEPEPFSEEAARIISYTIYAEARGEPLLGKRAVAAVIQTRSRLTNQSLVEVCLKEKQFSCWNEISEVPAYYSTGDGLKPDDISARSDCYGLAWVLMSSKKDWGRLTHFYNPEKANPSWARLLKDKRRIGRHVFGYMEVFTM